MKPKVKSTGTQLSWSWPGGRRAQRIAIVFAIVCMTALSFTAGAEKNNDESTEKDSAGRPCVANFSKKGGFIIGTTMKTFQEFPSAKKDAAFTKILQSIAIEGFQITASDRESGLVSASKIIHEVLSGKQKNATLNATLTPMEKGGVRVDLTGLAPSGTKLLDKEVQKTFCNILEAVDQKN